MIIKKKFNEMILIKLLFYHLVYHNFHNNGYLILKTIVMLNNNIELIDNYIDI